MWHKVVLSGVLLVWIKSFFFSLTSVLNKAKEHSLPNYLPIAEKIDGFMPFSRVLEQIEMLTALSRFWNQVKDSIFYIDNYWSKCISWNSSNMKK